MRAMMVLAIVFLFSIGCAAQSALEPGSSFEAEVNKTVSAGDAKAGDPVTARIVQAIKDAKGRIIVPRNATVVGHVVEASARAHGDKETLLGVALDRIVWKTGEVSPKMVISQTAQAGYEVSLPGARGAARMTSGSMPGSSMSAGALVEGATMLRSTGKNVSLQKGTRLSITVIR